MQPTSFLADCRGFCADTVLCVLDTRTHEARFSANRIALDRRYWCVIDHSAQPLTPTRRTAAVMDDFGDLRQIGAQR
jgi:hypothetical protein